MKRGVSQNVMLQFRMNHAGILGLRAHGMHLRRHLDCASKDAPITRQRSPFAELAEQSTLIRA